MNKVAARFVALRRLSIMASFVSAPNESVTHGSVYTTHMVYVWRVHLNKVFVCVQVVPGRTLPLINLSGCGL
jgi:hypothetical protein